ncbi:MAG TPA: hypothetical protein PK397_13230 [Ignavibacteriaceae bacterium]|jgi:hypothetical protein|nr:hypothetical protein [Ignavibacteriaceae bacterium]
MEELIKAFAAKIFGVLLDKILELKKEKLVVAFEVNRFSFGEVNGKPAVLALVSVTNKNNKPVSLSRFIINTGSVKVANTYLQKVERRTSDSSLLFVTTGEEEPGMFKFESIDFTEPIINPYLRENENVMGLILFKLPNNISGQEISIGAIVAGYGIVVSERIL